VCLGAEEAPACRAEAGANANGPVAARPDGKFERSMDAQASVVHTRLPGERLRLGDRGSDEAGEPDARSGRRGQESEAQRDEHVRQRHGDAQGPDAGDVGHKRGVVH
jgi:hypothetical protein